MIIKVGDHQWLNLSHAVSIKLEDNPQKTGDDDGSMLNLIMPSGTPFHIVMPDRSAGNILAWLEKNSDNVESD